MTVLGVCVGVLCVGAVLGSRMLQLYLQLPLVYPKLSSLAGEAEVFVLRVTGGDGPLVLGKPPPPSDRLARRLLGLVGASAAGILGYTYSVDTWEMAPEQLLTHLSGILWQMDR